MEDKALLCIFFFLLFKIKQVFYKVLCSKSVFYKMTPYILQFFPTGNMIMILELKRNHSSTAQPFFFFPLIQVIYLKKLGHGLKVEINFGSNH